MKKKNKQFAVIGLGRFGTSVANTLYEMGYEVLAVDNDENRIQDFSDQVTHVIQADTTDEEALIALGIRNFDVVIVAIGENVQANTLTALQVKEMGVPYVVAKASNNLHGKLLQKIGVDRVVYPERDMGRRVAHNLVANSVLDYIELSPDFSIVEVEVPQKLQGKTLLETDLRSKYEINVVAIKRDTELIVSPPPTERFAQDDIIVVVGSRKGIEKLEEMV